MSHSIHSLGIRLFVLLSAGLLAMACKSQEDMLPSATQSGRNTLGCLINGKSYVPNGGNGFMALKPIYGGFFGVQSTPYRLGIYVYTYARDKQRIEIYLNTYELGEHILNGDTQTKPVSLDPQNYGLYESSDGESYVTSSKYTGRVSITKADTATGIVSGTFEFKAATPAGKTVTVSNGRFDVNARTQ